MAQQLLLQLVPSIWSALSPYIFNQAAEALRGYAGNTSPCRTSSISWRIIQPRALLSQPSANTAWTSCSTCVSTWEPIAPEKLAYDPTTSLTFLGIELDTVRWEARLLDNKLAELRSLLHLFTTRRTCTKSDLLSLLGKLNIAASVVVSACTFMRRLWDCVASVHELYHHVQAVWAVQS